MNTAQKALAELRRPVAKRSVGGHGDFAGFFMLLLQVPDDAELFDVDLPRKIACSTCRFLTPEFHERTPCWNCATDEALPKWRPA